MPEGRARPGVPEWRRSHREPRQHRQPGVGPCIAAGVVTKNGKPKYSGLHALRHFYASWCINRRVDGGLELPLKVVQHRLGHSSIQMTSDRYGHLFPSGNTNAEMAAAEKSLIG